VFRISDLGIDAPSVYKAKKFACRVLKGKGAKSGIRIIYAYFETEDRIELVEIYYKGDKENEDLSRILKHYKR
jgi:phosphoserine aminotransferase